MPLTRSVQKKIRKKTSAILFLLRTINKDEFSPQLRSKWRRIRPEDQQTNRMNENRSIANTMLNYDITRLKRLQRGRIENFNKVYELFDSIKTPNFVKEYIDSIVNPELMISKWKVHDLCAEVENLIKDVINICIKRNI